MKILEPSAGALLAITSYVNSSRIVESLIIAFLGGALAWGAKRLCQEGEKRLKSHLIKRKNEKH